jgi:hypothetical protein
MNTVQARIVMIAFAVLAAFAAGCGGGGGSALSGLTNGGGSNGGGNSTGSKSVTGFYLHIIIPATGGTASERRRPKYISSATAQLAYTVDGTVETPVALSTSNPDCTGSPVSCTVPFPIAPGAHTFSFTLEDSNSNALSGSTNVSYTITAGSANTLTLTLGGIVASIVVQSQSGNGTRVTGNVSNGFQIFGNSAVQFAVVEEDADGNTIVGAMPSPSVQPSSGAPFTVASPSAGSNVWTLTSTYQPTNPTNPSNSGFTIVASPVPSSGPTTNFQTSVGLQLYQPWIYVLNSGGGGSITAYDEQGNQKTLPAYPVSTPQGIAIDTSTASPEPNVGDIYVSNVGGPTVKAFTAATAAPTTLPGSFAGIASPGPMVFDAHNDQLYLANLASSGQTMEAYTSGGAAGAGFSTTTNIANATALAYDSVDNYIFLASGTGNKIYEFSEAGAQLTTWTTSLSNPSGLAYDPNSGWIYVANKGTSAITAYNTGGTSQTLSGFSGLTSPTAMLFDPHSKVFYVVNGSTMKAFSETGTAASLSGTFPNLNTPTEMFIVP